MQLNPRLPFILLLIFSLKTSAQQLNLDSLVTELGKAKEDTSKVILYRMLAGTVLNKDPLKAVEYGKAGAALDKRLNFDKGIAGCYLNISAAYSNASKLDSALNYIDTAIVFSIRAGDPNRLALAYLNRADFNMQLRNLRQSLMDCDTALQYAEKANNNDRRARILQTFGSVYYIQNDYKQSRDYYEKALALYESMNNKRMSAIVLNNMGNIDKHEKKFREAIHTFTRAIQLGDSVKDINNLSMYYGNLSDVYSVAGNYELAEKNAGLTLEYALQQKNPIQEARAHSYFAQVYLKLKNTEQAIQAANKAFNLSKEHGELDIQNTTAGMLAEAYSQLGDHVNAYRFLTLSKELNDTLLSKQYNEDIAAMQTSFKLNEKNNEIVLLNKDRELQQQQLKQQQILIMAAVALVILSLVGIGLLVSRHRLRQRMKELQIRNQIAADLHDEVGSSLSSIHMLSEMVVSKSPAEGQQKEILHKVSNYTRETMDKMGDIVWMIKPVENEGQGLKERMQRFLYEICNSRNMHSTLEASVLDKTKLSMQRRKGFYLVFKEAVNNAVKYSEATQVEVKVTEENRALQLLVKDNGKGFDRSRTGMGNGLENMENRAKELGGHLEIQSGIGKGTTVKLTVPV